MPTFSEYLNGIGERGRAFNQRMKALYDEGLPSDLRTLNQKAGLAASDVIGTAGSMFGDTVGVVSDYAIPDLVSEPLMNGFMRGVKGTMESPAGRAATELFNRSGAPELIQKGYETYQNLSPDEQQVLKNFGGMFNFIGARGALPFVDPAMKGYALSGVNNLIDGWYGTANIKLPPALDSLTTKLSETIADKRNLNKTQAKQVSDSLTRGAAIATYGMRAMRDGIRYQVDPVARALYRSTGANPEAMRLAQNMMAEKGGKLNWQDYDRIVQQAYYGRHIKNQRGRKGGNSQVVQRLENIPVLADTTVPVGQKGFYKAMAAPYSEEVIPENIYDALESHLRNIPSWKSTWKKPTNVVLKDNAVIGGNHMYDFYNNGGYPDIKKVFTKHKKKSGKETFDDYESLRDAINETKLNPIPDARLTPEMKDAGGVWVTLGKVGSSITEGGVNVVYRVDLDGTIVGMLSDKHDFIEKATDKMFKQNQMAVTQPFVKNIWSGEGANNKLANPDVKAAEAKAAVEDFVDLSPNTSDLLYENSALANKLINASQDNEEQQAQ